MTVYALGVISSLNVEEKKTRPVDSPRRSQDPLRNASPQAYQQGTFQQGLSKDDKPRRASKKKV